ncbi:MAG: hypothetical protein SGBAC_012118 [Bacillariaceae sp.]
MANANTSESTTEPIIDHPRDYSSSNSNENKNITRTSNNANESHDETQTEARPFSYCGSTVENWMRRLEVWKSVDLTRTSKSDCNVTELIESTLGINLNRSDTNHEFIAAMKRCNGEYDELQAQLTALTQDQKALAPSEQIERQEEEEEAAVVSETDRKSLIEEILKDFPNLPKLFVEEMRQYELEEKQMVMQAKQNLIQLQQDVIQLRQDVIQADQKLLLQGTRTYIADVCWAHKFLAKELNHFATRGNEIAIATSTEARSTESSGTYRMSPIGPEVKIDGVQSFVEKMRGKLGWEDDSYLEILKPMARKLNSLLSLREGPHKTSLSNEKVVEKANDIVAQILLDDEVPKSNPGLNIRGLGEITVTQPILHAIIYRLMDLVGRHNIYVSKEQATQGKEEKESNHRMDMWVHAMREHLSQALPGMIESIVEIKKCGMIGKEDDKRIDIAADQLFCSFFERMQVDLNYLGIGVNCELYGVALSMSKIAIVTASLQNVGTEKVCIAFNKTETVPFLTLQGLELLALALSMSLKLSKARHMPNIALPANQNAGRSIKLSIGDYLGSGAFGIVYKAVVSSGEDERCKSSHFLKLPTSERTSFLLKDEAVTLRRLNGVQGSDKVPNIPSLIAFASTLEITLDGFVGKTSGLLLRGVIGTTATAFLWTKHREGQIRSVVKKVHDTLEAAHKQSVYHLDIRPGNIVVKSSTNSTEDMDVLVIDWGVAITDDTRFLFRGLYAYAHDELLKKGRKPSCAKAEYDWASLLYTYYHLHVGDVPWIVLMADGNLVCDTTIRKAAVSSWWGEVRGHIQGHGIVDKLQIILGS